MKDYDAARHKRTRAVAEAQDHVRDLLGAMLDPDNEPTAVFPLVIDGVVTLWQERMMEETGWRDADARAASDHAEKPESGAEVFYGRA